MEFPKLEHHTLLRGLTPPPEYFTRPHKIYRSSYVELKPLEFEPMEPIQLLAIDKDVFKILDGRREWKQAAQVNENTEYNPKIDDVPAKKQTKALRFDPLSEVRTYDVAGAPADVHNNLSTFRNIPTLGELPGKDLNPLNSSNSNIFANFVGKKKKEDEAKAAAAAFFRDVYPTFKKMRLVASVPLPSTVTSFDEENAVVPDTPPRLKQRVKRRALADRLRQANSNSNDNLGVTAAPTYVASTVVKCLNFSAFPVHDDKNLAPAVAAPTAASNRLSGKKRCTAGDPTGPPVAKRVCLRDVDFNFSISSTTPKNTFTAMDIDDEEEKVLPVPAPTPATAATNNRPAPQKAASRKKTHAPNKTNTSSSKPESKKKVGKPVVKKTTQGGAKIVNPAKSTINNAWSGRLRARKATPS